MADIKYKTESTVDESYFIFTIENSSKIEREKFIAPHKSFFFFYSGDGRKGKASKALLMISIVSLANANNIMN